MIDGKILAFFLIVGVICYLLYRFGDGGHTEAQKQSKDYSHFHIH